MPWKNTHSLNIKYVAFTPVSTVFTLMLNVLHSHYVGGSRLKVRRVSQTHEDEDPFQAPGRLLNLFESQFSHWQKEKFVHVKVLAFCLLHDGHSVNVSLLFLFNPCQNKLVET